jgi:hypothetical protein
MSDMPDDVYKKYYIRSEYSLSVECTAPRYVECDRHCRSCNARNHIEVYAGDEEKTSNLSIEYKTWFLLFYGLAYMLEEPSEPMTVTNYWNV